MKALSLILFTLFLLATSWAARPNVVVFLSDDQGWGDFSVSGNPNLQTPNIDSLSRDGVSMDRFYVCPVCSPTRAEFLTGRYHPRSGVYGTSAGQERLDLSEKTVAEAFKAAGYATGAFGKWHNGSQWPYHPNARGFDTYYGFTSGHWGEYFDPPLEQNGQPLRGKGYVADDFTTHAIQFIEKNKDQPFFCYLPFNTPHSPFTVPDEYWQRFKDKDVVKTERDAHKEVLDETRCVLAMCENLDWNVGRVLKSLEDLKLAENTIVIYFCDNGPNTLRWNGGMKGKKGNTDEGGVRSPLFIRWPAGLPKGRTVKEISGAIDLLPTLTSLAGVSRVGDKPLDGRDLSPLLKGDKTEWPERHIFSSWGPNVSVRTQQYRLDNQGALFDMIADPGQNKDIAAEQPQVAASLSQAVAQWRNEVMGPTALLRAQTKGQAKGKGKAAAKPGQKVDERPIPVGYREMPRTPLPARDGDPRGGVQRSSSAPNCSYFVNWTTKDDSMVWNLDVNSTGDYEVEILYTAKEAGAKVELSFNGSKLEGRVAPAWDPPLYTNQDTLPRPPAESQMKEFRPLKLGAIHLEKGKGTLTLRALEIPGNSVMDVRLISLTLQ